MTHAEAQELMAAYVLNALEPHEARVLDAHLAECDDCRRELEQLREVGATLASGFPQAAPPPALREALLATVRPPAARRRLVTVGLAIVAVGMLTGAMILLAQRMYRFLPTEFDEQTRLLALLAGLVVIGVVVAVMTRLLRLVDEATAARLQRGGAAGAPSSSLWLVVGAVVIVLLGAQVLLVQRQNDALSGQLDQQGRLLALLVSPESTTVPLTGPVRGSVRLVYNTQAHEGVLSATGLAMPKSGSVYQLWLLGGPKPESAAIFSTGPQGTMITVLGADFARYHAVAVTVEPGPRGSPQPTTKPVLIGSLSPGKA